MNTQNHTLPGGVYKLERVYIGDHTSRFEYGKVYITFSFKIPGDSNKHITTFLDKDGVPAEFNTDTLHLHFITLADFTQLDRDKKINEILNDKYNSSIRQK